MLPNLWYCYSNQKYIQEFLWSNENPICSYWRWEDAGKYKISNEDTKAWETYQSKISPNFLIKLVGTSKEIFLVAPKVMHPVWKKNMFDQTVKISYFAM